MIITTENGNKYDLSKGLDLSIPLSNSENNPRAWHVDYPKFEPVITEQWKGAVQLGGSVNFRDIFFNPHGHGTHTECLGHITSQIYSVNQNLHQFFFNAYLITVIPETMKGDKVIFSHQLEKLLHFEYLDAVVIRTLPNPEAKMQRNYSNTNPPFLDVSCLDILDQVKCKHLLVDLPSVDKEQDGGELAFHHGFWDVPNQPNFERTITELIYVPQHIKDGAYLLNLQVAPFENDASPSRPVLYSAL